MSVLSKRGGLRVLLFSGHMIDAPGRTNARFPAALEKRAVCAIASALDKLAACSDDTAIASAACGGDILFGEAVLERGVALTVHLPFVESEFVRDSVAFAGARWVERYRHIVTRSTLLTAPQELGPLSEGADPYERVNLWMLDAAQRSGRRMTFICLWNGEGGDGAGGTKHMRDAVAAAGGDVCWIDTRTL